MSEEIDWPDWFNPDLASAEEKARIKSEYVEKKPDEVGNQ